MTPLIKKMIKFFKIDACRSVISRLHWLLVPFVFLYLILVIKENKQPNGKVVALVKRSRVTILMLDSNRYRGDIDVLGSDLEFRVLFFEQRHLSKIQKLFINIDSLIATDIIQNRLSKEDRIRHNCLLNFLKIELTMLSFIFKIK